MEKNEYYVLHEYGDIKKDWKYIIYTDKNIEGSIIKLKGVKKRCCTHLMSQKDLKIFWDDTFFCLINPFNKIEYVFKKIELNDKIYEDKAYENCEIWKIIELSEYQQYVKNKFHND